MNRNFIVAISVSIICLGLFCNVDAQNKKNNANKSKKIEKVTKRFKTKEEKYAAALMYYQKGAYLASAQLLEEIYPLYMSVPEGDTILFLFADSYMKNNDFLMAAFHFNDYIRRYPQSNRVELAAFLAAKCYYLNSPAYNLDQSDSKTAIEGLQSFISAYPSSRYVEESNAMIDTLRNKLAHKDFSIAKMYYNTENYKAAQICFQNLLKDYPSSDYTEEALYYMVKNSYAYAQNSIESKKAERYQAVLDDAAKLKVFNADSKYMAEVEKLTSDAKKKRDKILNNN
ncbi:MAG: outer membrane protein assembly factor BamD [Bacteroidales bacterium]|nr:outer membrane protein assembly factor BamD [Bacteroidales bacterium]